jgi:hypothetical protein
MVFGEGLLKMLIGKSIDKYLEGPDISIPEIYSATYEEVQADPETVVFTASGSVLESRHTLYSIRLKVNNSSPSPVTISDPELKLEGTNEELKFYRRPLDFPMEENSELPIRLDEWSSEKLRFTTRGTQRDGYNEEVQGTLIMQTPSDTIEQEVTFSH